MDYGAGIRKARAIRGLSQKDLAAASSLNPSYISMIESGQRVPSMVAVEGIAKALGVPVYLLLLLASGSEDLRGIDPAQASSLGEQLLQLLVSTRDP
jgi:transcriptional regulator with XRE-family HTH domain